MVLQGGVKVRDLIKAVERDGWKHVKTKGSHRQYKHRPSRDESRFRDIRVTIFIPAR